jgi:hypothetical protein
MKISKIYLSIALLKNTRQAGLASVLHPMQRLKTSSVKQEIVQ